MVLFLSNNGPAIPSGLLTEEDRRLRYVSGMRGHKGNIWENGIRSPLWIRWKGTLDPADTDQLADVTDLFPTLMELAGVTASSGDLPLDGQSLLPVLGGGSARHLPKTVYLYGNPGWPPTGEPWTPEGVRDEYRPWKCAGGARLAFGQQILGIMTPRYKLLMNPGPAGGQAPPDTSGFVLVDLLEDPLEAANLSTDHPSRLSALRDSLEGWYRSVLEEPHAFEMPVFTIGAGSSEKYSILAYAPHCISEGVRNASNYIHYFMQEGDSATYRLKVEQGGEYIMELQYRLEGGFPRRLEIILGDHREAIELIPGQQQVSVNSLILQEGPATLTLKNPTTVYGDDLRLVEAVFHRKATNELLSIN